MNGATQSATCCTMCKRGQMGIEHEIYENGCSVLGRRTRRVIKEAGVVPCCRRIAIEATFSATPYDMVGVFYPLPAGGKRCASITTSEYK